MWLSNLRTIASLIKSDWEVFPYSNHKSNSLIMVLLCIIGRYQSLSYQFWLRLCCKKNPFWIIARLMHERLSRSYGVQIPWNTKIGRSLIIYHSVGIVINNHAVIGDNCKIHQGLTIGATTDKAASIGNNVYIGPNVCIVENVRIGNNVKIGAGTVVINDIPDNCTSVGNPNRNIQR